ncbi:MAG: DUF5711 family protein [Clostridia bacterium]|nr:DUF5711 family protein [Clostridia bacterium]
MLTGKKKEKNQSKQNDNTIKINKARAKTVRRNMLRKLRVPFGIAILIAAIIITFAAAGEIRRSNIVDSFRAVPSTLGESPGYPYDEDDLTLNKVMLVGEKPLLLNNNGVEVLSQNADLLFNLHLDWSDAKAVSHNGRALVFSNTSQKAYLISRTKQLAEYEEDGTVVTGTLASNGSVALSYSGSSAQSVVKVYDPNMNTEFMWNCSKEYVASLALSDNGKKVAISAIGADNAELYSRLILFRTGKTEPDFDIKISGTTVIKMIFTSGDRIIAVGNNKTLVYNTRGKQLSSKEYSEDSLYSVNSDDSGNTLLCYKEFGGSKLKAVRIPASGKRLKEFELDYIPSGADILGKKIVFSLDNKVIRYNTSGEEKETIDCKSNPSTCLITGTAVYTLENGTICKY